MTKGLLLLSALLSLAFGVSAQEFKLRDDARIVIAQNAAVPVKFAAEELCHYLKLITGREPQIVTQSTDQAQHGNIFLGDSEYSRRVGIDASALPRDGFVIKNIAGNLYIVGRDTVDNLDAQRLFELKRDSGVDKLSPEFKKTNFSIFFQPFYWDFEMATAYGTWRFLRELGVRWLFPGPLGEYVPKHSQITLPANYELQDAPAFGMRMVGDYYWPQHGVSGSQRSRILNPEEGRELKWSAKRNFLWKLRMGSGASRFMGINHRPVRHCWAQRFYDQHPEYFALLKGGRRGFPDPRRRNSYFLCYTSQGMFNETVKDVDAFFSGEPGSSRGIPPNVYYSKDFNGWPPDASFKDTFSLLPHDGMVHNSCQCDNCKKQQDKSKLIWEFVRRVAEKSAKKHPDKFLTNLAYADRTYPPKGMRKLPANVIVVVCPVNHVKVFSIVKDGKLRELDQLLASWRKLTPNRLTYWMHMLYRNRYAKFDYFPMIVPHSVGSLMQVIGKHCDNVYIQYDRNSMFFEHLNRYVFYEKLWHPNANTNKIINDYILHAYGPKAFNTMKKLYKDIEDTCVKLIKSRNFSYPDRVCQTLTLEKLTVFAKAAAEVERLTRNSEYHQRAVMFKRFMIGGLEKARDESLRAMAEKLQTNVVTAYVIDQPVKLDGRLDDPSWTETEEYGFYNTIDGKPIIDKAGTRLLVDKDTLYIGIEHNRAKTDDHIMIAIRDENFEQKNWRTIDHNLYLLTADMNGKLTNRYLNSDSADSKQWASNARIAAANNGNSQTLEIAIPLKSLGKAPSAGTYRRLNVVLTTSSAITVKDRESSISRWQFGSWPNPRMLSELHPVNGKRQSTAKQRNLITNGDFEQWHTQSLGDDNFVPGQPKDWSLKKTGNSIIDYDPKVVHGGRYSAKLKADKGQAILYQTLAGECFKVGKTYELEFYWRSNSGALEVELSFKDKKNLHHSLNLVDGTWRIQRFKRQILRGKPDVWNHSKTTFKVKFVPLEGKLTFAPDATKKAGDIYIDDAAIHQVP